ncbi:hypothetical protein [uncultured Shewanella sp.]|uniref:hypothetical protein n=1 Tax=uncultured Shewanella sp. TaxID=173975 RepID=UPI00260CFF0C|nr:hypothetical protein [uncultured Shewanella sp.]
MKNVILTLVFLSPIAVGGGLPKEVSLTPALAEELGFSISVTPEGAATMVELKGPRESPSSCLASRSGTFLLDQDGEELLVHITELPKTNSQPEAVGYYTNSTHTMGVFIDYLCKEPKVLQSIRYTVQSTSEWLITSKGTGRSKAAPVL